MEHGAEDERDGPRGVQEHPEADGQIQREARHMDYPVVHLLGRQHQPRKKKVPFFN